MLTRRTILATGLGAASLPAAGRPVRAQPPAQPPAQAPAQPPAAPEPGWPDRPVRIVVPFPPGGSTDLLARQLAEKLNVALGQTVLVENRAGAGGTTGSDYVAKSAPDGNTLLMGVTGTHGIAPSLFPNLPYQPLRDFAPVSLMVTAPLVLVCHPSLPATTLAEFVALAKARPGTVTYGTPGNGTSMHLTGVLFDLQAGTQLVHVPYRGTAGAMNDLVSGQIQTMFGDLLTVLPQVRAGGIRAIAVTAKARNALLPAVPTMDESGLPGFQTLSWQGLFAPARTPPAIVERLSRETRAAMTAPDVNGFFAAQGFAVGGSTPAEFRDLVAAENTKWAEVVRAGNVRPD
ncbi:tripartite tricarboxylate transporter substrate binding protein [Roseomonas sp. NAR14]|uniref:Tripartite tricarboxylate transporter substrate binding protein n=1 Tax=Roseomonas acroporae TaxID=2937791 RepID=A0A9X1Y915_9PROT|nr:tripartite tricarboxylate transporter substrate binding protein [Roseomonas acroporae]MCK8784352.1 tripartite tricarboxylate transporter substrate binding protein [Roseomonas acroporae]